MEIIIHTDGGAKGNPGPAAIGIVIEYDGKIKEYGEKIGKATNNVAEYSALIYVLKKTHQLIGEKKSKEAELKCYSDSELMVKQLKGEYRVKNKDLRKLFLKILDLIQKFKSVTFHHVLRDKNKRADELLNEAISE